jgi:hypothetical protein
MPAKALNYAVSSPHIAPHDRQELPKYVTIKGAIWQYPAYLLRSTAKNGQK